MATKKATVGSNVKTVLVEQALARLELDTGGSEAERADRLEKHYREHTVDKKLGKCDVCLRDSDVTEKACPFCGDDGEVVHGGEPKAEKPKAEKPKLSAIDGGKAAKPAKEPKAPAPVDETHESRPAPKAESKAMVYGPENLVIPATLDEAIADVRRIEAGGKRLYWELGRALLAIFAGKLHLQRKGADGAPLYKTWTKFVEKELSMTARNAYRLMDVAEHFSAEDVQKAGVGNLAMLVTLGPDDQQKLLARAKEGLPRSALARELRDLAGEREEDGEEKKRAPRGDGFRGKPNTKGRPKKKLPTPKDAPGRVTVALVLGRVKIPLMAKPVRKGAELRPAKKVVDEPRATEVLENGVEVTYTIVQNSKGELLLVKDSKRPG